MASSVLDRGSVKGSHFDHQAPARLGPRFGRALQGSFLEVPEIVTTSGVEGKECADQETGVVPTKKSSPPFPAAHF